MEDPLDIYDYIVRLATEEFREEDHPRDEDGQFVSKGSGTKKTKMDDFFDDEPDEDYEEPENDYDELDEEELEIDYDNPKYTRAGLDDETLRKIDQNDKWQKWEDKGGDQSVFDDPKELEDYEEWVTENPYRLNELSYSEQEQLNLRKFEYWRNRQILLGRKIEAPLVKNWSNRWSVDVPKFFTSLKNYMPTDPDIMFEREDSKSQQYLQRVDDFNIGFSVREDKRGEFIEIAIDGFVPESEKDEDGNNLIRLYGSNGRDDLYGFSKSRFDKFLKKHNIELSDKSGFYYSNYNGRQKQFSLHAKDAHKLQELLPFFKDEIKRNADVGRIEKDNFDSIQNTKGELADLFPELTDKGAMLNSRTMGYQDFRRDSFSNFEMNGEHIMWYGNGSSDYFTIKITKRHEQEPTLSIKESWGFEREISRNPELKEKLRVMLNIFGGNPDDSKIYLHNSVTIPQMKEMREFYVDYNEKMAEIKRQQKELEEQQKNKREELDSKYQKPYSERTKRYEEIKEELAKQWSEQVEEEDDYQEDQEEDDDDDFSEKDITIDYDPRKINLDAEPEYA